MSSMHKITFEKYEKLDENVSLPDVLKELTHPGELVEWPLPDCLHVMKNGRARIAQGSLAFGADNPVITTKQLTKELESMNIGTVFEEHNTFDLLKDEPALTGFQLRNLLMRWEASEVTDALFMLPLVALNLAIRNPVISVLTRIQLLEVTFHILFRTAKVYPQTGKRHVICSLLSLCLATSYANTYFTIHLSGTSSYPYHPS
jgi:hypothetical protein